LGNALKDQAQQSDSEAAALRLGEAVVAFRDALKVYTHEDSPQKWAATQNNLGSALKEQAQRTKGLQAVSLLDDREAAFGMH